MQKTVKEIYNYLDGLRAPGQPLDYIAQLNLGGQHILNLQYPFITVGLTNMAASGYTIGVGGSDMKVFRVQILVGQKDASIEAAFYGNAHTKGILQILDQLEQLLRGQQFNGSFTNYALIPDIETGVMDSDPGEFCFIGKITVEGQRKERRPHP